MNTSTFVNRISVQAPLLALLAVLSYQTIGWARPAGNRQQYNTNNVNVRNPYAADATHDENQQSRSSRWDSASPNQQATTYNMAKSKNSQKQSTKSNASSNHATNSSSRQSAASSGSSSRSQRSSR